jgi:hypothetical protein
MRIQSAYASVICGLLLLDTVGAYAAPQSKPIPGYRCMMLNLTEQQSMDPLVHIPVRSAPSESAPPVGWAGAVVAVREPMYVVNGFAQILFPNGRPVWIVANILRPYRSVSDPAARCTPVVLPNGLVGFGAPAG